MIRRDFQSAALLLSGALCALVPGPEARAQTTPSVFALLPDGSWIDATQGHLSLSRELPEPLSRAGARDATRLVFVGFTSPPRKVRLSTQDRKGNGLDVQVEPKLTASACPPSHAHETCWSTLPLRLTPDRLDRDYPAAKDRSLEAALGGVLDVESDAERLARFTIGAPASRGFAGIERLSARLRVRILRVTPGGPPAIGGDTPTALHLAEAEVAAASQLWAACGVDLQGPKGADIAVVDPPAQTLLAVGCDAGLPASGGQITVSVGGRRVSVSTHQGDTPLLVAERLSRAAQTAGVLVELSPNQRTNAGAGGAVDLLLRGKKAAFGAIAGVALSTDVSLPVCLGEVDLSNGLTHFVETDATAGTLEERSLIKAFADGDPSTIEVFIVPSFDQSGRIGESFIDDDGAAIQNTVIIDRAAVRAGPRSNALAHEIGHILLAMPGHPDDYGVDQASSLMDADAADASVFGPRRLSLADCERALRESGPTARIPLLEPWPLADKATVRAKPATSAR